MESIFWPLSDEASDEGPAVDNEAHIGSVVESLEIVELVTSLIDGRSLYWLEKSAEQASATKDSH